MTGNLLISVFKMFVKDHQVHPWSGSIKEDMPCSALSGSKNQDLGAVGTWGAERKKPRLGKGQQQPGK